VFIGHYAPALALKPVAPRVPLWALFVGVQLLDFGWDALVLAGVEHVRITPGITESNDLDLYDMPLTHSLAAAVVWSAITVAATWRWLGARGAGVLATAVLSHWWLDLLVHRPDLSLAGASTPMLGLGLWNYPRLELALEIGLVIAAGVFAAKSATRPRAIAGLTGVLVLVAITERLMPAPTSVTQIVISAFVAYVTLAAAAWWSEREVLGTPA